MREMIREERNYGGRERETKRDREHLSPFS